jgi:hypothetical protein
MVKTSGTFARAALNAFIASAFWLYVARVAAFRISEMYLSDTPKERKNSEPDWEVRFDHSTESIREVISSQGWVPGA